MEQNLNYTGSGRLRGVNARGVMGSGCFFFCGVAINRKFGLVSGESDIRMSGSLRHSG